MPSGDQIYPCLIIVGIAMKITALLSWIMLIEMVSKSHIPEREVLVRQIGGGGLVVADWLGGKKRIRDSTHGRPEEPLGIAHHCNL